MSVTECKSCGAVDAAEQTCTEYIPCLYERLIIRKSKSLISTEGPNWKILISVAVSLYAVLILLYQALFLIFPSHINDAKPYNFAVFVIASIIFWPFILIYDSRLYYTSCCKIQCLLTEDSKDLDWYRKSATRYFCLIDRNERGGIGAVVTCMTCLLLICSTYFLKIYCPSSLLFLSFLPSEMCLMLACIGVCTIVALLSEKRKNLLVVVLFICFGVGYYTYITIYAEHTIPTLLSTNYVFGTILIIMLVGIVFFIAGTTICPMLGLFKTFFLSNFEDKIDAPVNEIAGSLDKIQVIKGYFQHLTGINLVAYFQLLGCVYFLGILNSDSIVTKVLFLAGSFFPMAMYLAASVFFKKLCRKIYSKQVKGIDTMIYKAVSENNIDPDNIQALVAIKEMYANEFEVHAQMNKEVFLAMLTPVASAFATIFSLLGS